MIDERTSELIARDFQLFRRERATDLHNERETLFNAMAIQGLERSGALMAGLKELYYKELVLSFNYLWKQIREHWPTSSSLSDDEATKHLRRLTLSQLDPLAKEFDQSLQSIGKQAGLPARWSVAEKYRLVRERVGVEIEALLVSSSRPRGSGSFPRVGAGERLADSGEHGPIVFISYAWENEGHKLWVRGLAERLRASGINARLDQLDLRPGDELTYYMEQSVSKSDYVLVVCTPTYKEKADNRAGGVGYEDSIMTAELYTNSNQGKFVPILRGEEWQSSAPTWMSGKMYVDLRGDPYLESEFQQIIGVLSDSLDGAPPLGQPSSAGASIGRDGYPDRIAVKPVWKSSSFIDDRAVLARMRNEETRRMIEIRWVNGPQAFLRLIPSIPLSDLKPKQIAEIICSNSSESLLPMCSARPLHSSAFENDLGAVVINSAWVEKRGTTNQICQVFTSGEIWGIDGWILREDHPDGPCIPMTAVRNTFEFTISNFFKFAANHLRIQAPVEVVAGLSGVGEHSIPWPASSSAVSNSQVDRDEIIFSTTIETLDTPAATITEHLMTLVWESAGLSPFDS